MALTLKVPTHTGTELGPVVKADLVADMQALQDATLHHVGAYNAATAYLINDLVTFGGATYLAKMATTGTAPVAGGNATWTEMAAKGPAGAVGPQGSQGSQGPQGVQGPAGQDAAATAADRVQTGLDAAATTADRVQTGLDATATTADRVQTGLDATATATAKTAAQAAEANAIAVVTGGTASITPAAGKIPLADSKGRIDGGWLDTIPAVSQALPASLNIVDCCVSLGKNDSDGRAWAKRCQHTSWYNEARSTGAYINTLPDGYASAALAVAAGAVVGDYYYNTATAQFEEVTNTGAGTEASAVTYRAGSAEFLQDVAITAETNRVIIWDITGAQPTMWMVFNAGPATHVLSNITSIALLNGTLAVGSSSNCLVVVDFVGDVSYFHYTFNTATTGRKSLPISGRNGVNSGNGLGLLIINATVNDVAITTLPDAPIDSATGLPVLTIYVATNGNGVDSCVTAINDDGTTTDMAGTGPFVGHTIDADADGVFLGAAQPANPPNYHTYWAQPRASTLSITQREANLVADVWAHIRAVAVTGSRRAAFGLSSKGGVQGTIRVRGSSSAFNSRMFYQIRADFSSGWRVGDDRRCYLANSLTADRSVKAGTLTVVGTVTETVNAGGRNVYSGFSAANYFQEASHADFNALGTGDFSIIMSGVKWGTAGTVRFMLSMGDGISAGSLAVRLNGVNRLGAKIHDGTTFVGVIAESTATFTDTAEHVVEVKRGTFGGVANTLQILVDGAVVASAVSTLSTSNATGFLRIGEQQDASNPWAGGQCACVRISATAPTAEQSKFISDQENALNGGATCLLSNSNAVSALSYDADTDILHVSNGTNIDQFVGLQRVSSAASSAGTLAAIASRGGIKLEAGSTGGKYAAPAISIKSELTAAHQKVAKAQQGMVTKMIASDASSVLTCPQGFKPIRITSAAGTYISLSTNVRVFDGFIWSIDSGLAASTNYDVEMVRV